MGASLGSVRLLSVYPTKGEPGRELERADVTAGGLAGDRPKKRPVHVVGLPETPATTRANVFVDVPDDRVRRAVGSRVRLGGVVLELTEEPSGCPGLYATVAVEGAVEVGADVQFTV